ncbi:hypothetical protein [Vibrio lentus]|uniref:hypothetical protein n=1 Tax=Vibrio lentus TaxID=136468 RepID=UPI000C85E9C1|nr:hypothetical protein [Vibrio lentus]PMH03275.1 hypothetical protein BCU78_02480 [Vibrio lentus]
MKNLTRNVVITPQTQSMINEQLSTLMQLTEGALHVEYEAKFNIVFQDYEIEVSAFLPSQTFYLNSTDCDLDKGLEDAFLGLQHKLQKYDDKKAVKQAIATKISQVVNALNGNRQAWLAKNR